MNEKNVDQSVETDELSEDNTAEYESGTDEAESGEESEVEAGGDVSSDDGGDSEEGGDDDGESHEARKTRAQAQIERLKEENKRLKEEKRKAQREGSLSSSTDMMAKAFLAATHDIREPEAQEEALRLADKFDMTVDELMEDPDYKNRVASVQKRLVNQRKVAATSGNAGAKQKGAEYVAEYFKKNQTFPKDTPLDIRSQAIDIVNGKQKQTWQR